MQNINEMTLEEGFAELDNMIKSLSDKNVPLEEAFAIYENGTKILKHCREKLDMVEKKMLLLNEQGELKEIEGCYDGE